MGHQAGTYTPSPPRKLLYTVEALLLVAAPSFAPLVYVMGLQHTETVEGEVMR